MPLRLDVKRLLLARSDRVKCLDIHPTEPWLLVALYNGNVHIWNYDNQQLVKSFELKVCDLPVKQSIWLNLMIFFLITPDQQECFKILHFFRSGSLEVNTLTLRWRDMRKEFITYSEYDITLLKFAHLFDVTKAFLDGERLPLSVKDLGACEIYPQTLIHSSNGRFVVACGDGEYIVYTAMALRNKDFGQGLEFVWSSDPNMFAVRESATSIRIKKNFKEFKQIRTDVVMEGIDGGPLLATRSQNSLCFYDWESARLVRRIEIAAKHVFWSDNGEMVAICGEDSFYLLKYNADAFVNATCEEITEDGVEDSMEVIGWLNTLNIFIFIIIWINYVIITIL
uniref:Beta'-coat protein n=1 Tax=Heterorhabditis bacteriophora TaxID=37862 RepID=A0A1I7X7M2_HETBA